MREDLELLFLAGQRPIIATKLRYYADREFTGSYCQSQCYHMYSGIIAYRNIVRALYCRENCAQARKIEF